MTDEFKKVEPEVLEALWEGLGNVLFADDDWYDLVLDEPYHIWDKGTPREHIWHWFDEQHAVGLYVLLGLGDSND